MSRKGQNKINVYCFFHFLFYTGIIWKYIIYIYLFSLTVCLCLRKFQQSRKFSSLEQWFSNHHAWKSLGGLTEHKMLDSTHRVFDSASLCWGLRLCIHNEFLEWGKYCQSGATFWGPLLWDIFVPDKGSIMVLKSKE